MRGFGAIALLLAATGCGPELLYEGRSDLEVEPLEVRLVRVTADGLAPAGPLELVAGEGNVTFLNDTRDRLVTVVVPRPLPALRCTYTQGFASDGAETFAGPLAPGASASLCLHEPGDLRVELHGAGDAPLALDLRVRPAGAATVAAVRTGVR